MVVEDYPMINQIITEFLKENYHEVFSILDGKETLTFVYRKRLDLIILDIMLPSMTGLEVLQTIRKTSDLPIIC